MYKNKELRPLQWEDKMEYVSTQNFIRCASKQYISNYQIHYLTINAVFRTSESKKSINLISKLGGGPILHAVKINKQYF